MTAATSLERDDRTTELPRTGRTVNAHTLDPNTWFARALFVPVTGITPHRASAWGCLYYSRVR
jgi:hypothetical protein